MFGADEPSVSCWGSTDEGQGVAESGAHALRATSAVICSTPLMWVQYTRCFHRSCRSCIRSNPHLSYFLIDFLWGTSTKISFLNLPRSYHSFAQWCHMAQKHYRTFFTISYDLRWSQGLLHDVILLKNTTGLAPSPVQQHLSCKTVISENISTGKIQAFPFLSASIVTVIFISATIWD